jgi:hypothetical protein
VRSPRFGGDYEGESRGTKQGDMGRNERSAWSSATLGGRSRRRNGDPPARVLVGEFGMEHCERGSAAACRAAAGGTATR